MNGGAEGVQHLHLLQDVLPAGGADDQQLPTLQEVYEMHICPLFRMLYGNLSSAFGFIIYIYTSKFTGSNILILMNTECFIHRLNVNVHTFCFTV